MTQGPRSVFVLSVFSFRGEVFGEVFGEVLEKHLTIGKVDKQGDSVPFGEVLGVCGKKTLPACGWLLAFSPPESVGDGI